MKAKSYAQICARTALEAGLSRLPRDHAGQIAALRQAIVNTANITSAPPIGILVWPNEFPRAAIEFELNVPSSRFRKMSCTMNE